MNETIVCVGGVVRREDGILLVRQSPGHSLEGQWTIPWGQIEPGESMTAAVLREVKEEAGVSATVDGLLGIQELPEPWIGMVGILFSCSFVGGEIKPDMRETDAAKFYDRDQIEKVADSLEPLTGWLVGRIFAGDFSVRPLNHSGPFGSSPTYL